MSLVANSIRFSYGRAEILYNVGFEASKGEVIGILGPNGSGKTTLLKCLNRILTPMTGNVEYDGMDLWRLNIKQLADYMSYVPQDHGTPFPISVIDIILMGRIPRVKRRLRDSDKDTAFAVLQLLGLEHLTFRSMNQLSGGERQRVTIARALAQEAPIILMDEPTNHLDIKNQVEILHLIREIVEKNGLVAVFTLHDINLAAMFCHKIALIKEGKVFESGPVNKVITEKNIKSVYGIDTEVMMHSGDLNVRLLQPNNH